MHFFLEEISTRKAVTNVFLIDQKSTVFLEKKTVPWTVEAMAGDTCHSSVYVGQPLPKRGPGSLGRTAICCPLALVHSLFLEQLWPKGGQQQ